MSENQNLETLKAVLAAFNNNDIEAAAAGTHPEVKYIVRGRSSLSGTYEGREGFAEVVRGVKALTNGSMTAQPEVVMAQGDNIMMYMHITGSRPDGRTYDSHQAYLYRFQDGKIIEGQTIPVDQHAFEEFLSD